ncbi:hypothetical protein A0H81_11248 [Grifola frondosa]|uniref:RING-type domain-containing protein n=1 Tax=Grifola frondosa TaxID=5627 RepID=A0A1C7M0R6_GRIFR|nr:hypothetical protein A0H81_11248 [Grifola frondosa]
MDPNEHNNNGFIQHLFETNPHIGNAIQNIVRGFLHQHQYTQPPHEDASNPAHDADDAHMPPLEVVTPSPQLETVDGNMTPVETSAGLLSTADSTPSASSSSGSHSIPPHAFRSDSVNLTLAATSGSSQGDSNLHDIEMVAESEGATGSSSLNTPMQEQESLPPSRNSRRARVEDEADEELLRETNRQRMYPPLEHESDHHYAPIPDAHQPPIPTANDAPNVPPLYGSMMWTFDFIHPVPHVNPHAPADAAAHEEVDGHDHEEGHDHVNPPPHPGPMFNFFINIPVPPPAGAPPAGTPPGVAPPNAHPIPNGNAMPTNGAPTPAQFFEQLMGGGGFFDPTTFPFPMDGFPFSFGAEERDDPERAKRLVDGLEEVPVGLVKRMERVGGPGTTEGDTPNCAICWESLLNPEGGGFEGNVELANAEAVEAAREATPAQSGESSMDVDDSVLASASHAGQRSASSSQDDSMSSPEKCPQIVVLPCSHVFHASCLLPWFSKPHRTTCPSCRFDIDPESLTYRPRPYRHRQAQTPPQGAAQPDNTQPRAPQQAPTDGGPGVPFPSDSMPNFPLRQIRCLYDYSYDAWRSSPATAWLRRHYSTRSPQPSGNTAYGHAPVPARGLDAAGIAGAAPAPGWQSYRADDPNAQAQIAALLERIFGPAIPGTNPPNPAPNATANPAAPPTASGPPPPPLPQFHFPFPFAGVDAPPRPEGQERDIHPETWQHVFVDPPPPLFNPAQNIPPPPPFPFNFEPTANMNGPSGQGRRRPSQKRQWTLPPPPGPTLRQRIERKEHEMGLRCSDMSCGLGPSDEDPTPTFDTTSMRQIFIHPLKASDAVVDDKVCDHSFHPSCLVSAERVAGWGREDKEEEKVDEEVEVSCPVCRAVGRISQEDWEEGACALA